MRSSSTARASRARHSASRLDRGTGSGLAARHRRPHDRTPGIALTASSEGGAVVGVTGVGGTESPNAVLESDAGAPADRRRAGSSPPRASLAASRSRSARGKSWFEMGVDVAHGLAASPVLDAQQLVDQRTPRRAIHALAVVDRRRLAFQRSRRHKTQLA